MRSLLNFKIPLTLNQKLKWNEIYIFESTHLSSGSVQQYLIFINETIKLCVEKEKCMTIRTLNK